MADGTFAWPFIRLLWPGKLEGRLLCAVTGVPLFVALWLLRGR